MKYVLSISSDKKCSSKKVFLDDEEADEISIISEIVIGLLKEDFSYNELKNGKLVKMKENYYHFVNNAPSLVVEVKLDRLYEREEITHFKILTIDNVKYFLCKVHADLVHAEWDMSYFDHYPHEVRNALQYRRKDSNICHTAFHAGYLPDGLNIEKMEIMGLNSQLKKSLILSEKLTKADRIGIFTDDDYTIDHYVCNLEIDPGYEYFWLKILK